MAKKLFVAGLAYSVTDDQLNTLFSQHGTVVSAKVIMDRETGRSKGFGFVEMSSDQEATNAVSSLNEQQFEGRNLSVKEAVPKTDAPFRPQHSFSNPRANNFNSRSGYNKNSKRDFNRRSR